MSDSDTKQVRIDGKNAKKNRSGSHPTLEDETEKQLEMQLLDSPSLEPKIKQPKKEMPSKKKSPVKTDTAGGGDSSMFGLTINQLKTLMELHGKDLLEKLNSSEYNGIKGILEKLHVDGNKGLDTNNEQDLQQRRTAYGRNEIPPKPMKSFIALCWDALHDMLLVILLVCAVFSIGLSFYKPPEQKTGHQAGKNETGHQAGKNEAGHPESKGEGR
jgi:magnesium-transporting ATPase (P-type)